VLARVAIIGELILKSISLMYLVFFIHTQPSAPLNNYEHAPQNIGVEFYNMRDLCSAMPTAIRHAETKGLPHS
jgi:hypothetical protein